MVVAAACQLALVACGNSGAAGFDEDGGSSSPKRAVDASLDANGASSASSPSTNNPSGTFNFDAAPMVAPSDCKAGHYQGSFNGNYSSNLILGIPLVVMGDVQLTLNQAGSETMMCMVSGEEGLQRCSDVFNVSGGSVTGTADQLGKIGDAGIGGFPYLCALTGTLDCAKMMLVNGWIECTYCVGSLAADGGMGCDMGIAGHFAGPVTGSYDKGTHSFTMGTWNGAESLAGNDGTMPLPEGGTLSDYLALDGGYGFLGKYGGAGTWTATLQ